MAKYFAEGNPNLYVFKLSGGAYIDAGAVGSVARFINHSCNPNCHTERWEVAGETRVGIYASRALTKGTELSYNYFFGDASDPTQQTRCLCSAKNCSGWLGKRPKRLADDSDSEGDSSDAGGRGKADKAGKRNAEDEQKTTSAGSRKRQPTGASSVRQGATFSKAAAAAAATAGAAAATASPPGRRASAVGKRSTPAEPAVGGKAKRRN
jgi:hypothetical protein